MSCINQKKKRFLIKLMVLLGYGGMVAYCIGGCDSKPAQNETQVHHTDEVTEDTGKTVADESVKEPESVVVVQNADASAEAENDVQEDADEQKDNANDSVAESESAVQKPDELIFEIKYSPSHARVSINSKVVCKRSPCRYKLGNPEENETVTISAEGYGSMKVVLSKKVYESTHGVVKVSLPKVMYPRNPVQLYAPPPPPRPVDDGSSSTKQPPKLKLIGEDS